MPAPSPPVPEISTAMVFLGVIGASGALLMFAADLVLYLPATAAQCSTRHYFTYIDPGAEVTALSESSMQHVTDFRLMLGGVMGPVAAVLYAIGFAQVFFALQTPSSTALPCMASIGYTATMIIGGVYHSLFAYTGFLSKAIAASRKQAARKSESSDETRLLLAVVGRHRTYLRFVYRWAATASALGSFAFVYCCLVRGCVWYPRWLVAFTPSFSAPIKAVLKRRSAGGLVIVGGLTNLWNLLFFAATTASVARTESEIVGAVVALCCVSTGLCFAVYPLLFRE